MPQLGLIIVDEEHDLSYKQQEGVRYSARDLAIVRAQKLNIPLVLGSATPSLESLHNALSARYLHLKLTERAQQQPLPQFQCISTDEAGLCEQSISAIRQAINQNQQVLVFINRRGYAPVLFCQHCKWISQCPHCDSRMTVHKSATGRYLHCHSCDSRSHLPSTCPSCNSTELDTLGEGTQRSEEYLQQIFPHIPVIRIDRDNTARKGKLEKALDTINQGEPCIMVGTQMLAKGHHFANLGLAVMLGMDNGFFSGDFRGAERMGQLFTQVGGRVGRENHTGKVLVQTQFADHPLFQQLMQQGYGDFANTLLNERTLSHMPPFAHLALIRCHAQNPTLAQSFLREARSIAERIMSPRNHLQYLGPFASAMEKRNNRFHYFLQIKAHNRKERQYLLQQLCAQLESKKIPKGLRWFIDVDPQET